MDSGSLRRGLGFTNRKKRWIVLLGLVGFSAYGVYKVYHMPYLARKRKRILKLFGSLMSMAEMVSDSSETIAVMSRDLKEFLKSDSDEIPNSLKQLSKIVRSEEFSESVVRICQAMTIGILRGHKVESSGTGIQEAGGSTFSDRIMEKLMSSAGTGFASVVVGSFARNLVLGFYANGGSNNDGHNEQPSPKMMSTWLCLVSDDNCRVLIADCIKTFVSTAVAVYLDKTMDVNVYDEMFSGLTNPKHKNKITEVLVSLCNGAVETLVKSSHQVLTSSKQGPVSGSNDPFSVIDQSEPSNLGNEKGSDPQPHLIKDSNRDDDIQNSGWVSSVSSALAVPRNRKFVLDITGRVTFETVRSVVEFFLWKISEGLKRSVNVVHSEVVERGFEVVRYVGYKSSVILTICLALFLHILGNTHELLTA